MGCILTRLNGLECPTDTPRDVGRCEHLNDGLEYFTDIPKDVGCLLLPMRVGMNISKMNVYVGVTVLFMVH